MNIYSKVWLTTFGDLLTLLLCFMIVTVSQSDKVVRNKAELNQAVIDKKQENDNSSVTSGKEIASKKVTENQHVSLLLEEGDFNPAFWGLSDKGIEKLDTFLKEKNEDLELGLCDQGFAYGEAAFETLRRRVEPQKLTFSIGNKVCKIQKILGANLKVPVVILGKQAI